MTHTRRSLLRLFAAVSGAVTLHPRIDATVATADPPSGSVVPREEWGALPSGPGMRPHQIDRITLHHTGPPEWYGAPSASVYLRAIQSFHMGPERRWPDIAYHLLIDLDGVVWEGRSLLFAGDTATDYDPTGHALIAVLGDYSIQHPNAPQRDTIVDTVRRLMDAYSLTADALYGHRDYAATVCPGDHIAVLLDDVRRLAEV
jgi:hypothetical protein